MEEHSVKVITKYGEKYFDNLDKALCYIKNNCSSYTTQIFRLVDGKWIPSGTVWPDSKIKK